MGKSVRSVYIHIPFCKRICSYCDFAKVFYNEKLVSDYLVSLRKEILEFYGDEKVETIYIGGGTPSSLSIDLLEELFDIISIIDKSCLAEFTIEVNPEDISLEKLELFKERGVNRISIGHQTCNLKYLIALNRKSYITREQIGLVKKYFSNISVDLMYGFSNQTEEELLEDLDYIISLDVSHISTYSLILEEHTKLFIDKYKRLDDDSDAKFYGIIQDRLKNAGYNQYEISNFSKCGFESLHNLTYWNNFEYYGFGVGASGYIDGIRYSNTKSVTSYIRGINKREEILLSKNDKMVYEMILGLRKTNGVCKEEFFNKYSCTIEQAFDIMDLVDKNLIEDCETSFRISDKYLYLENQILVNFLEVHDED